MLLDFFRLLNTEKEILSIALKTDSFKTRKWNKLISVRFRTFAAKANLYKIH